MDKNGANKMGLWGGVIGAIVIALFVMLYFVGNKTNEVGTSGGAPKAVSAEDWVLGDTKIAKAVLIEYSDFQCPACGAYYPIVKQLEEDLGDKVAFIYRHFPLSMIHKNAMSSSLAAEAAGKQGKFWEMHDMLFEKQKDWSEKSNAKDIFTEYANLLGLDIDKFKIDQGSAEMRNKVQDSFKEGSNIGIAGTPTFFLNGKKIQAPASFEEFKNEIIKNI